MLKTGLTFFVLGGALAGVYLGLTRYGEGSGARAPAVVDMEAATPRSIEIDRPEEALPAAAPKQLDPAFLMSLSVTTEEALLLAPVEACSAPAGCESAPVVPSAESKSTPAALSIDK